MRQFARSKVPLIALVGWCVGMLIVRMVYSRSTANDFLLWNLVLAVVPVVASSLMALVGKRRGAVALKAICFLVWLAFLPNAPYLVTDFVHLTDSPPVPLWYDVALFGSFAATGALLGYASVAEVESVLRARLGAVWALAASVAALLLCGFGIYLGRFLRLNSWDVLTAPGSFGHQVVHQVVHPISHPASWEVPVVYGLGLVLGYLALRSVAPLLAPPNRKDA
jgi:uncharacterized membrane protein